MKRISSIGLASFFLCLCLASGAQDKQKTLVLVPSTEGPLKGKQIYTNSHALLIGVNQYPHLPKDRELSYAIKDVEGLKAVLVKHYGFPEENVKTLLDKDATLANIKEALASFADKRKIQSDDRILIYFSGHGQTVKLPSGGEMGFILPYDAKVDLDDFENAGPYLNTCLGMDSVKNYLDTTPAKHTLVLADACYSGLLTGGRAVQPSLAAFAALAAKRSSQVITAGRKGEVSVEMANLGHGAFTYKLIEELKARATTPGDVFHAYELYSALSISVANVTEGKQSPTIGALGTDGQFFFIVAGPGSTVVVNPPASNPGGKPQRPAQNKVESVETVARVKVETNPPGAKIFLNGQVVPGKVTPATIELDLELESSREVEIGVKLDGHKTALRKATLVRGQNPALAIKLDKAAVQPPVEIEKQQPAGNPESPIPTVAGAVSLSRNFKAGASVRARLIAQIQGMVLGVPVKMKLDEIHTLSVASVSGNGLATLRQQSEGGTTTTEGIAGGEDVTEPIEIGPPESQIVDRLGKVVSSDGQNEMFDAETKLLVDIVSDALLPGRPVAVGESWKSVIPNPAEEGQKMTLNGKFLGVEAFKGVQTWKIKQTAAVDVSLDNGQKFQIDMTFWVHPTNGLVLRAEGTLTNVPTNAGPMIWTIKMQAVEIN